MKRASDSFLKRPTCVDEFMRCLIWRDWDPSVAFDAGSKYCLDLKPDLIRESIRNLRKRSDLSRYTHALGRIVRLSQPDASLIDEWQINLRHLRALLHTSAMGTDRQRAKLLEIACNARVVKAMRYALRQECEISPKAIEPSWIAVLYAEGSNASVREADRFKSLLKPETQAILQEYLDDAQT